MELAFKDIRRHLGKFLATIVGVALLLAVVLLMNGIYRGNIADGVWLIEHTATDLWVVEGGRGGPFNEASRMPLDSWRSVAATPGVQRASPFVVYTAQRRFDTTAQQRTLLLEGRLSRMAAVLGLLRALLVLVSTVVIGLIVYVLTIGKIRAIATLKLVGAPNHLIVRLIVTQALLLTLGAFLLAYGLRELAAPGFPRTLAFVGAKTAATLAVIQRPTTGRIAIAGQRLYDGGPTGADVRAFRRERVGFVFQQHNLIPFLDARDNVALLPRLNGVARREAGQRAQTLLDGLGLGHRAATLPARLSGGEQQRVAIARALANDPVLVLADEPTAALDTARGLQVMQLLRGIARTRRAAVIVVTHDLRMIEGFDTVYRLEDGAVARVERAGEGDRRGPPGRIPSPLT